MISTSPESVLSISVPPFNSIPPHHRKMSCSSPLEVDTVLDENGQYLSSSKCDPNVSLDNQQCCETEYVGDESSISNYDKQQSSITPSGSQQSAVVSLSHPQTVVAGNDIPAGASLGLVCLSELRLGWDLLQEQNDTRQVKQPTAVHVYWENGQSRTDQNFDVPSLLSNLPSARDRHEQNLQIVRDDSTAAVMVLTMRPIRKGETLWAWYGEELAIQLGVPILTPFNIRGYQDYICTHCSSIFYYPNTLKAHIMLKCSLQSRQDQSPTLAPFHFFLHSISQAAKPKIKTEKRENDMGVENTKMLDVPVSNVKFSESRRSRDDRPISEDDKQSYTKEEERTPPKSAFKRLSSSLSITRRKSLGEASTDDSLMTPDSSTDQPAFFSPAMKFCHEKGPQLLPVQESPSPSQEWPGSSFAAAQHMASLRGHRFHMPYAFPVPVSSPLQPYFPLQPNLHSLSLQFLQYARTPIVRHDHHPLRSLLETTRSVEHITQPVTSLNSQMDVNISRPSKPHTSSLSPASLQQHPQNNPYTISLPSDKEPLDLLPQTFFANKSKRGHLCLCCGKLYSRKYGLKIHMRTHNGYKPLKCKICSRPFGDPSNLNKHVRLHAQGETPYRCDYCGKVLVRRRDLERHIKSRHPMASEEREGTFPQQDEELSPDSSPVSMTSHDEITET